MVSRPPNERDRRGEPDRPSPAKLGVARVVAACSIGSLISISTVIVFPFAVFAAPIASDFGWSKSLVTALIGPALLLTIPAQPLIGWAVARYPRKRVAVSSMGLLALAAALMAAAPADLRGFSILLAVSIAISTPATNTVYNAIIAENVKQRRGLVLGATSSFAGVGIAIIPPALAYAIEAWGWRGGYLALAALAASSSLALFALLPAGGEVAAPPKARVLRGDAGLALRDPVFWKMAALFLLFPIVANAIPLHLPLILEDRGSNPKAAAASLSVLGAMMILSRPLAGLFLDFLSIRLVLLLLLSGPLLGSLALVLFHGTIAPVIAAAGFGAAVGGEFVCLGYMVSRAFAVRGFGVVFGLLAMTIAVGVSLGPMAVSALLSWSNGYTAPLEMVVGVSLAAMAVALTLGDSRFAAHDRHKQQP